MKGYRGRKLVAIAFVAVMVCSAFAVLSTALDVSGATGASAFSLLNPTGSALASAPSNAAGATETAADAAYVSYQQAEASLQAEYTADAQQLEAHGALAKYIHLPSTLPSGEVNGAVVPGPMYADELQAETTGTTYAKSPSPTGITYYGESGSTTSPTTTIVDTTSLAGTINVTNLSALYLDTDNPDQWGAQLNGVVTNVTLDGARGSAADGYAYWVQNVIGYQQFNSTLQFDENTWNFTTSPSDTSFPTSGTATIVANDTNDTLDDGEVYIGESQYFYAPTPFNLTFYTNLSLHNNLICNAWSSLHSSSGCTSSPAATIAAYYGDQTIFYNYSLSFPASNTKVPLGTHYSGNYDWLTFHTASGNVEDNGANTRSAGMEASGKHAGVVEDNDFELDFGIGAYDGATQDVFQANGTASLDYVNDCTASTGSVEESCTIPASPTYKSVPAALNFGAETGETGAGLSINYESTADVATFSAGPGVLHSLWGYTTQNSAGTVAVTNHITVTGSPLTLTAQPYIFIFIEDTSVTTPADGFWWSPDVPVWYLNAGTYDYEAFLSDYTDVTGGTFTVSTSPVTVTATLPYASSNGVYTPLWALTPSGTVANAELAGISSSGAGTQSSPYVLFANNDTASSQALNSVFESDNDYEFPTFSGVLLYNTTAYVEESHGTEFYTGSTSLEYLQQQFYETQHVTIAHTGNIQGYGEFTSLFETTPAQNPIPTANVMIWNSTNDLVMGNTFLSTKAHSSSYVALDDLLLFGGGSGCTAAYSVAPAPPVTDPCGGTSGPAAAGSRNVVWGNLFYDTATTSTPSSPGTYAGIAEAEDGDLIYNNEFKVDNPAPLMPWDIATEEGPVFYSDTWNVSEQAASNVAETVNGFALSGNVLGSAYALQGGNYWWNFGGPSGTHCATPFTANPGCLNSFANATYNNQVDYTDGAATIFPPPYTSNYENGLLGTGDAAPIPSSSSGSFTTTFSETGLPASTTWYVNVTLPGQVAPYTLSSSAASQAALYISDGSYPFTVASANAAYSASAPSPLVVKGVTQTVTIAFSKISVSPSATHNPVDVGQATTISAGASGGSGTYTSYVWSGLPSSCASPGNVASFSCTPTVTGPYTVQVTVTDSNGGHASGSFTLTVDSALVVSPYSSHNPTQVDGAVTISAGASGGSGTYSSYVWSGSVPTGCTLPSGTGTSSFGCTPGSSGNFPIQVAVTDSNGNTVTNSFTLGVDPALFVTLTANVTTTQIGGSVSLSLGFSGGVAPISYTLQASGPGLSGETFTPTSPGVYTIYLNATDAVGSTSTATVTITVEPALVATLTANVTTTQVGGSVLLTIGLSGGVAPVTYTLQASGPGLENPVFTPGAPGVYTIYLNATDAVGSTSDATVTITVEPALYATLTANVTTTQVGGSVTLSVGLSGGVEPVTYTLQAGCAGLVGDVFTPVAAGSCTIYLNATDAVGSTSDATVTITVESGLVATLSANVTTTQVGGSVSLSVGLSGGVEPVTYTLQAGCAGLAGDVFTPVAAGSCTIYLNATDAVGSTSDATVTITVESWLVATLSANVTTTQVGGSVTLSVGLSGGVEPVTYTLQAGCAGLAGDVFTPVAAGSCTIYLNATDAVGSHSDTSVTITVKAALVATLSANVTTTQVGGSVSLSVGLSGGVEPVTYTLQAGCAGLAGDVFTPVAAGSCTIYLNATDAVGSHSDTSVTITVKAALVATLTANVTTTQVGGSVSLSVGLSGGVEPVTYTLQAGCAGLAGDVFTPVAAGSCTIYLNATDAVGSHSDTSVTITVKAALVATLSPATSTIHLGGSVTFVVGHTGGVAPVTYTLRASGPGLSGTVFTPTATGTYTIYLNATDAVGSVSDVTATVVVESSLVTKYTVTFTETGLPVKGESWQVSFNGSTVKTAATSRAPTVTSVEFNVTNGTYPYLVTGPSGYGATAPDGSVFVAGEYRTVDIAFTKGPTPTVTLHETGLAGGSKWSVTLGGTLTASSKTANVVFKNLTPASYAYSIGSVGSATTLVKVGTTWTVTSTGTVSNAKGVTVPVRFAYLVTFTETGLASGTSWSVTSQGQTVSSTGTALGLYLTNGSVGFTVHKVTGYTESSSPSGHVTVSGAPASVSVKFTAKPGGEPAVGVPATGSVLQELVRAVEAVLHL